MSLRRRAPRALCFTPRLEALEARDVPAGNVDAHVFKGVLYVTGDDLANAFRIDGAGTHTVAFRPLDATTTINHRAVSGSDAVFVGGITKGYHIRTYGGNDQVFVFGTRAKGQLNIDTGDGDDDLRVSDIGHRGATILGTGAGNDSVIVHNSWLGWPLSINTGLGDDQMILSQVRAKSVTATNPGGTDFFNNLGSTLRSSSLTGFTNGSRPTTTSPPATPTTPDTTAPSATVSAATGLTRTAPLVFTAAFSEAVTGFDLDDLVVTNGTAAGFDVVNDRTFTVRVTPAGQGVVGVSVREKAATDAAGNASTASTAATSTFDSAAPTLAITPLTTSDNTPAVTGTVSDSTATVAVTVNGQTLTAAVSGTTWSVTLPQLADGTYAVAATATDPAGNSATVTLPGGLVIDTVAPGAVTYDLAAGSDSGITPQQIGDLRTDAATAVISGTAEAGATVRLFTATSGTTPGTGTLVGQAVAASNGTFTLTGVPLAVGPNSFAARAVDAAGNLGPTLAVTFTRNAAPTVASPIANVNTTVLAGPQTFDLATVFADAERIVRLTTTYPSGSGTIDVNLFAQATASVANFVAYVNAGDYDNTVFHRLAPGFVLQGGGFEFNDAGTTTATVFPAVTSRGTITNEANVSNTKGTIAYARSTGVNSATSEFFFNLADNSANLDVQNSGFAVFGQVMNGGQQTLNALGGLSTYPNPYPANANPATYGLPGAGPFPVGSTANTTNFPANINAADVALITTAAELTQAQKMTFAATSNSGTVQASVSGSTLTITPLAPTLGTPATIVVTATDLDGSVTTTSFTVTVS